jgi:hypothetical protein
MAVAAGTSARRRAIISIHDTRFVWKYMSPNMSWPAAVIGTNTAGVRTEKPVSPSGATPTMV